MTAGTGKSGLSGGEFCAGSLEKVAATGTDAISLDPDSAEDHVTIVTVTLRRVARFRCAPPNERAGFLTFKELHQRADGID